MALSDTRTLGRAGWQEPAVSRSIALWLLVCCAMVFVMVVLGGLTRLTHSGLSIVEWQPLIGTLPPLSEVQWQELFAKYQQTPEYLKVNFGMPLEEFKSIFWLEYFHRLWGRLIGIVFLLPFLGFLVTGRIPRSMTLRFIVMFILGGLQGVLGWYMVKSGLIDRPSVSHYRLAAHLSAAFLIYGFMFWVALDILRPRERFAGFAFTAARTAAIRRWMIVVLALVSITVLWGALVAGLRAGLIYNTFPLMGDRFIPDDLIQVQPWLLNFLETIPAVQFAHRILAEVTVAIILGVWWLARRAAAPVRPPLAFHALLAMAGVQAALGIATLLLVVPVALATLHQAGALVLFTLALWALHDTRAA